jgi:hypothetical protein
MTVTDTREKQFKGERIDFASWFLTFQSIWAGGQADKARGTMLIKGPRQHFLYLLSLHHLPSATSWGPSFQHMSLLGTFPTQTIQLPDLSPSGDSLVSSAVIEQNPNLHHQALHPGTFEGVSPPSTPGYPP